jgi:hypothetical protein
MVCATEIDVESKIVTLLASSGWREPVITNLKVLTLVVQGSGRVVARSDRTQNFELCPVGRSLARKYGLRLSGAQ